MPNLRITCIPILLAVSVVIACEESTPRDQTSVPSEVLLDVSTRSRGTIREVGRDTLSDHARVVALYPEPTGEALAVLFADSAHGVSAGLALMDERAGPAALLWPDSVTRAWWSEDHRLSFTTVTGEGAYVIVDVHDPQAAAVLRLGEVPPTAADSTDLVLLGRAQQYIDSIRVQPTGTPAEGELAYTVTGMLLDPSGRFGAYHVTARGKDGRELNPAWYVVHLASGRTSLIDEIVGEAGELPRAAGGWSTQDRFIYAKGATLHEASVRTRPSS